jgi:hypothetical protein
LGCCHEPLEKIGKFEDSYTDIDPDLIYGLANRNRLNPMRRLELQGIALAHHLTDDHMAFTKRNLKLAHISLESEQPSYTPTDMY